jgi:hypothetical protein
MSNLTPVKVLDKNNRLVTRYVRQDTPSSAATMPAPVMAAPADNAPTSAEISEAHPLMISDMGRYAIDKMRPDYRTRLMEFLGTTDSLYAKMPKALTEGLFLHPCLLMDTVEFSNNVSKYGVEMPTMGKLGENVSNFFWGGPQIVDETAADGAPTQAQKDYMKSSYFMYAVSQSNRKLPADSTRIIQSRWQEIEPAAPLIILRAQVNGVSEAVDSVLETAALVRKYPDRMSDMIAFTKERGYYDETLIAGVLDAPSFALREGHL